MTPGKYKLLAPHYFAGDIYLDKETIVGEGTNFPFEGPPSFNMEPLDDAGREEMEVKRSREGKPDTPADVTNATGMNLAPGPGQKVFGLEAKKAEALKASAIPTEELARRAAADRAAAADPDLASSGRTAWPK